MIKINYITKKIKELINIILNKLKIRIYARILSCYIFFVISKLIYKEISFCGVSYYKKFIKSSDKLFIIAPGVSILNITDSDFKYIKNHDSIAINYAVAHNVEFNCNLFEPHNTDEKGYFKILLNKKNKNIESYFLIKGYNSPQKIYCHIKNILDFSKSKAKKILLMKDGYLSDYKKELTTQIQNKERYDFLMNHFASIIYCIDLAITTNYNEIIFCGVDMSHDYFYFHGDYLTKEHIKNLNKISSLNLHANNEESQKLILDYFTKIRFSSNIKMYTFKCIGPLNDVLPEYHIDDN